MTALCMIMIVCVYVTGILKVIVGFHLPASASGVRQWKESSCGANLKLKVAGVDDPADWK